MARSSPSFSLGDQADCGEDRCPTTHPMTAATAASREGAEYFFSNMLLIPSGSPTKLRKRNAFQHHLLAQRAALYPPQKKALLTSVDSTGTRVRGHPEPHVSAAFPKPRNYPIVFSCFPGDRSRADEEYDQEGTP